MVAKLTRLTHKIATQLHLVQRAVPFAVLAPGGQSENSWYTLIYGATRLSGFGVVVCSGFETTATLFLRFDREMIL
jgi:hypothetical protein